MRICERPVPQGVGVEGYLPTNYLSCFLGRLEDETDKHISRKDVKCSTGELMWIAHDTGLLGGSPLVVSSGPLRCEVLKFRSYNLIFAFAFCGWC